LEFGQQGCKTSEQRRREGIHLGLLGLGSENMGAAFWQPGWESFDERNFAFVFYSI
jgi:hypothetical protein